MTNGGNDQGLFRAAFMQSGSPLAVGDMVDGQPTYDFVVSETGCSGANDTLQCLREVPYATFKAAIDNASGSSSQVGVCTQRLLVGDVYTDGAAQGSGSAVWGPRTDGKFLVEDPQKLLQQGSVARVPFITGVSSTIKVYSKQHWGLTCSCSGLR